MSNAVSRIVISLVLAPIVLVAVYFGDWWMFALVALAAAIAITTPRPIDCGIERNSCLFG